jgi:hypothetical protein
LGMRLLPAPLDVCRTRASQLPFWPAQRFEAFRFWQQLWAVLAERFFNNIRVISGLFLFESHQVHQTKSQS